MSFHTLALIALGFVGGWVFTSSQAYRLRREVSRLTHVNAMLLRQKVRQQKLIGTLLSRQTDLIGQCWASLPRELMASPGRTLVTEDGDTLAG